MNECSSALTLNPNYHRALVRRAKANEQLGLYKKALQDIQKANKTDTANPDTQVRVLRHSISRSTRRSTGGATAHCGGGTLSVAGCLRRKRPLHDLAPGQA